MESSTNREHQLNMFEKAHLRCRDVEALYGEYREGGIPEALERRLKDHIHGCDECQMFTDTYELVVSVAATLKAPAIKPKDGFRSRLHAVLNDRLGTSLPLNVD